MTRSSGNGADPQRSVAAGTFRAGARTFGPVPAVPGRNIPASMDSDDSGPAMIPAHECLRLLASVSVGRIAYTKRALPAVEPVRFAVEGNEIVIRTDTGSTLSATIPDTIVAFQADHLDDETHTGWTVTVVGSAHEMTDLGDMARLRGPEPPSWALTRSDQFIRIVPGIVTGRELMVAAEFPPSFRTALATPGLT